MERKVIKNTAANQKVKKRVHLDKTAGLFPLTLKWRMKGKKTHTKYIDRRNTCAKYPWCYEVMKQKKNVAEYQKPRSVFQTTGSKVQQVNA